MLLDEVQEDGGVKGGGQKGDLPWRPWLPWNDFFSGDQINNRG